MRRLLGPAFAVLFVAGCLSPAVPHHDTAAEPLLPSSLDVDLHKSLLNVSMPAGPSTAVVVLNVSDDMWVKRVVSNAEAPRLEDPEYYGVCVLLETHGLGDRGRLNFVVLKLEGSRLSPLGPEFGIGTLSDRGTLQGWPPYCVTSVYVENPAGLSSRVPYGVSLVVFLSSDEKAMGAEFGEPEPAEAPIEPFSATIGIGTVPCVVQPTVPPPLGNPIYSYCGPKQTQAVEPSVRSTGAGASAFFESDLPCLDCGFQIADQRTPTGPLATGHLTLDRTETGPRMTYYSAGLVLPVLGRGALSVDDVALAVTIDGNTTSARCTGVAFAMIGMGFVKATLNLTVQWNSRSNGVFFAISRSIPVDMEPLGWELSTGASVHGPLPTGRVAEPPPCFR